MFVYCNVTTNNKFYTEYVYILDEVSQWVQMKGSKNMGQRQRRVSSPRVCRQGLRVS